MAQSIETLKNKETRGSILRTLARSQFLPISSFLLQVALIDQCPDIMPHARYLQDKGYIRIDDVSGRNIVGIDHMISLTAHGIDLIEGSIPADGGIAL